MRGVSTGLTLAIPHHANPTDHPPPRHPSRSRHLAHTRLIAEASLPGATRDDFMRFQANFTDAALVDTNPDIRLIVACDGDGSIQGYIHLQPMHDEVLDRPVGYVSIVAVSESAAGQGIGKRLMAAAEAWAREKGYPALVLDVFASNVAARTFYAKGGFDEDSVRLRKRTA